MSNMLNLLMHIFSFKYSLISDLTFGNLEKALILIDQDFQKFKDKVDLKDLF